MINPVELTDFLLARIAKDEQVAREAIASLFLREGQWLARGQDIDGAQCYVITEGREDVTGQEATLTTQAAEHIGRWDPARVLAECDAKRRIVEEHKLVDGTDTWDNPERGCRICIGAGTAGEYLIAGPCTTLKLLALPYADHPDYREEWKP